MYLRPEYVPDTGRLPSGTAYNRYASAALACSSPNTSVDGERDLEVVNMLGSGCARAFGRRDHYTQ